MAARWASLAAVVALSAVATVRVVRPPRRTYLRIDRAPFAIVMPMPERSEPLARAMVPRQIGCSLPVSQIGLAGDKDLQINAPRDLAGVAASATGCTIAVWSSHDVLVSRDDGATFTRLARQANADPSAPTALAAAVATDETVYVIRAGRLEIELRDGTLLDRALPGPGFDRIQVSGRWLVVWSRDQLAVSGDAGGAWRVRPTPAAMTGAAVFIDETGVLHLAAMTARDAPLTYHLADAVGGAWRVVWTSPPHRAYADSHNPWNGDPYHSSSDAFAFGSNGKLYVQRYDAYGYQVSRSPPPVR
jgi:hypothetical protein